MATFHPFPRLPTELRLRVWDLTVEPRTVDFRIKPSAADVSVDNNRFSIHYESTRILPVHSSTPAPAALHACHEARNHLLHWKRVYQRVFCDIVNPARDSAYDEGYIYIHFELDTIDIGNTLFHDFSLFTYYKLPYSNSLQHQDSSFCSSTTPTPVPLASKILRLKFTRNFGDEYLDHWDIIDGLRHFVNFKEVFCVCGDGIMAWGSATEWIGFGDLSCGEEGVWLIDGKDMDQNGGSDGDEEKRARKAVEWDEVWTAFKKEREREREYGGGGGGYWYPPPPPPPPLPSPSTF